MKFVTLGMLEPAYLHHIPVWAGIITVGLWPSGTLAYLQVWKSSNVPLTKAKLPTAGLLDYGKKS